MGDKAGRVKQLGIHEGKSFFRTLKDYGNLGISEIRCFSRIFHIVFIAAQKGIKAIDLKKREIINMDLLIAFDSIFTIRICPISKKKNLCCNWWVYSRLFGNKN